MRPCSMHLSAVQENVRIRLTAGPKQVRTYLAVKAIPLQFRFISPVLPRLRTAKVVDTTKY
jgi:hypothetical protein